MSLALVVLCAGFIVLVPTSLMLLAFLRQEERLALRIQDVQRGTGSQADFRPVVHSGGLLRPVAALGGLIARSGLLSTRTLAELQHTLHTAGLRGQTGLSIFVGMKLLLLTGLPLAAFTTMTELNWWPSYWAVLIGGAAILGLLGPDFWVKRSRKVYLRALDNGMPDSLDMLVICSEAGLGLEAAFERVAAEIVFGHPIVAQEMLTTLQEMQINSDRRAALIGLGERTGLDSLRRLGGTLVQTMQYGTPLSSALRVLSTEMRQETLLRFEEKAGRLPVLLTMPMIIFIMPCVFLIVVGPAMVQVIQQMQK